MLFRDWHDFVTYPLNPDRVHTRAARLDTGAAFRRGPDGSYSNEYSPSSDKGAVIDQTLIAQYGDAFECMEIDDFGRVLIWTREKVWYLAREGNDGKIEKLRYVPRHPPTES